MLLFKIEESAKILKAKLFQYILCCCSSKKRISRGSWQSIFQYILCCCSRDVVTEMEIYKRLFQYILCCCSSWTSSYLSKSIPSFQYILCCCSSERVGRQKTRYVEFQYILCCCSSNKEYKYQLIVNVFQYILCCCSSCSILLVCASIFCISIHLMLLFKTLMAAQIPIQSPYFNTSYVVVQGEINVEEIEVVRKFQYILCCCSSYNIMRPIKFRSSISIHLMLLFK